MDKLDELVQLILEYVDYSQEKFMDKWEKEGKRDHSPVFSFSFTEEGGKMFELADLLLQEADYGGEGKIYKGFTKYHRIPTTSAVRDFCDKLEGVLMEKGIYPSDYLPDQLAAEAIALLPRIPKTLKKHTGYELLSLDGDILMSDAEEGAVRLSDGNYLIFYFEDSEVQYRKFGSSDGGL